MNACLNMITDEKLKILLERYFKFYLKISNYSANFLLNGKEYFIQALKFCENKNNDFPNLELVTTNNPDRIQDERFLFLMLDAALRTNHSILGLVIEEFDEKKALAFYEKNINQYIKSTILQAVHNQRNNFCIIEKYQQGDLHYGEWLTDIDLEQLVYLCEIKNCIITFCNFKSENDAMSNIGMALHFQRENILIKNPHPEEKITIPLVLEVGSSNSIINQGMHWASAVLKIDLNLKEISVNYADSLFSFNRNKIKEILHNAITFSNSEYDSEGKLVQFNAFPNFDVKIKINNSLTQMDYWSCGYRAFKYIVDQLPDNGNANFKFMKACPQSSEELLKCCFNLLLNNQHITQKDKKNFINTALENIYSTYSTERHQEDAWNTLKEFSLTHLMSCKKSKHESRDLIIKISQISGKNNFDMKIKELIYILEESISKIPKKENKSKFFSLFHHHSNGFLKIITRIRDKAHELLNNQNQDSACRNLSILQLSSLGK